jgi:hypothetical protein
MVSRPAKLGSGKWQRDAEIVQSVPCGLHYLDWISDDARVRGAPH